VLHRTAGTPVAPVARAEESASVSSAHESVQPERWISDCGNPP